jgi:hypothetical protein
VKVEAKGRREALLAALDPIVRQCSQPPEVAELGDGWQRVTLQPPAGKDVREAVAERLRAANLPIRELARHALTLEELFLRITAQAAQRSGDTLSASGPNVPGAKDPVAVETSK